MVEKARRQINARANSHLVGFPKRTAACGDGRRGRVSHQGRDAKKRRRFHSLRSQAEFGSERKLLVKDGIVIE